MVSPVNSVASIAIDLMARRDADGQWVHLIPAGTFSGRDGRGPFKLTNADTVIAASRQHAGKRLMPIDYDHAIDLAAPEGMPAPAAGWIKGLQSRADGIWGLVDWTPRAAQQLEQREYRYLSPVFDKASDGAIRVLLRASLTNNPNLDQLTALMSMETNAMDRLPELRTALGLPDDATIDDILAKIRELSTSQHSAETPDPSKYVPIGDFERTVSEVNKLNRGISLQAANSYVADKIERGQLLPWLKDWGITLCSTNKPAFDEFVSKTKGALQGLLTPSIARSVPPDFSDRQVALSDSETTISSQMGLSAEDFAKTKSLNSRRQDHNR
jgi:phage I-like protein